MLISTIHNQNLYALIDDVSFSNSNICVKYIQENDSCRMLSEHCSRMMDVSHTMLTYDACKNAFARRGNIDKNLQLKSRYFVLN